MGSDSKRPFFVTLLTDTEGPGRIVRKVAHYAFLVAIAGYLLYKMSDIGWVQILDSLPTSPLFYILFVVLFFSLPVAEALIYRLTWNFSAIRHLHVFIKKRVYNKDVLGYSGEVYLYSWARNNLQIRDWDILKTIRDNNILSSVASTAIAAALLLIFVSVGSIRVSDLIGQQSTANIITGVLLVVVLVILGMRFRRRLFSLAPRIALIILATHAVRLLIGNGLQILMWEAAIPEIDISVWLTFAATSIVVSRIPFVPNRDLIMLGAGIELAEMLELSTASITGLFVTLSVLGKISNLFWFVLVSFIDRKDGPEASQKTAEIAQYEESLATENEEEAVERQLDPV
ncbi:MAG: hypothetical protein HKN43_02345 [Rhodothermales bacterium]|nr:hypothetical protein [Rhodothermales bacterium]